MLVALCLILCLKSSLGAQELFKNPNFANHQYSGNWECFQCTLSSSSDTYHRGSSVKVTNRQHNWSGLGQYVTVQPGHTYIYSAYMKLLSNSHGHMYDKVELMLSLVHDNGHTTYVQAAETPHVQKEFGWFEIGFDFHVPGDVHKVYPYIQIADTSINYLVDHASFKELPRDNNWKSEANARINNLRKAPITVQLHNSHSKDTSQLQVEIKQVKSKFAFGTCVNARAIVDNSHQKYQEFFYDNFEYAVLENALKWRIMEWTQGHPDLDTPMRAVNAMRARGITVRGHNMFWSTHGHEPSWVDGMSSSQLLQAMHKHVNDVISRTRGTVFQQTIGIPMGTNCAPLLADLFLYSYEAELFQKLLSNKQKKLATSFNFTFRLVHWDVNNENLHGDFFEQHTKHANITKEMFDWIHQTEPTVKLFLNEYNVVSRNQMTTAYKGQAERMRTSGSPIYGVGVQSHTDSHQDMTTIKYRLDKIAEAGLPIWVTELTVNEANENRRADALEDLLTLFMSHPAVEGVLLWGYWDGQIWIKTSALATGSGVTPNAAGRRYQQLYKQTWRTHTTTHFTNNRIHLDGFKGKYVLNVKNNGHVIQTHNFTLGNGGANVDINF